MNISEKCFNELVESIQRQIDKKVEKGEVTPDEALKLEKKVNDKMSPEKHSQEWRENYEREAKVPGSLYNFVKNHQIFHTIEKARRNGKIAKFPKAIERAPQTENKVFPSRNEALEAMEIAEAIINELNVETAKSALNKRTDQSMKADEKDKAEFNKIMKIKDINKRAQAYKEYDKRLDSRLNKENKRLDVYVKWAKDHPELVEAFTLIEAIISEVSVGALKRVVDNNYPDRVKKYQELQKKYNTVADELEKENKEDMESEKAAELRDKLNAIGKEYFKAQNKFENADYLKRANLPDGKTNANKLFNAAYKSTDKRSKDYVEAVKNGADKKNSKEAKRFDKSAKLEIADPVKSRAEKNNPEPDYDYSLEETLKILELFDRPDLLNDIDTALGSPVKKIFKRAISSVAVPKKEKKVKECKK